MLGFLGVLIPGFYGLYILRKALRARREGKPYVFTLIDGGIWLRGKSTSPELMLVVSALCILVTIYNIWL
jgi:hypothetical protein